MTENTAITKPWQSVNDYKLITALKGSLKCLLECPELFGEKLSEKAIKAIPKAQRAIKRIKKEWSNIK